MMRSFRRSLSLALLGVAASAGAAWADLTGAQEFVERESDYALQVLSDDALALADKQERFRDFVDRVADVDRISRFVLGKYRNAGTPEEIAEFKVLFREYAIGIYEEQLGRYNGEGASLKTAVPRGKDEYIVTTIVDGGALEEPVEVNWRVSERGGEYRVLDVEAFGIWLAIQQKDDFEAFIGQNGRSISALNDELRRRLSENRGGAAQMSVANGDMPKAGSGSHNN